MAQYEYNGARFDAHTEEARKILASAHAKKGRPVCLCRRPPLPMYVAKVNEAFIIKRMPDTGSQHSPDCESYEPPPELSGLGQVIDRAIKEDPESGEVTLKLAFSMAKQPPRAAPTPGEGETTTVKSDGTKLTLRSLLHYLWDEAGFNRWSPAMEGKRSYAVVRKYLLQAAASKSAKNAPLGDSLYIPEVYNSDKANEIAERARLTFKSIASSSSSRKLMIVIAEVKRFDDSNYGKKVVFKHLPSHSFFMDEKFGEKLLKAFALEVEHARADPDGHLIMVGTFSVSNSGNPNLEEAALMNVDKNWIPYETSEDRLLLERLAEGQRRFVKGLRFNLSKSKPLASVVVTDAAPKQIALYLVQPGMDDAQTAALSDLIENSSLVPWYWHVDQGMPELPALEDYVPPERNF